MPVSLTRESSFFESGEVVVGLDEVGRGSLAGPVAVGALVLDRASPPPHGLADSKEISPRRREALVPLIEAWSHASSVGWASAAEVDAWGISFAVTLAARRALARLPVRPSVALIDGSYNFLTPTLGDDVSDLAVPRLDWPLRCETVVRGDGSCATIAGASVLAKVRRDEVMRRLHETWPHYQWDRNKGYGTASHRAAIRDFGACEEHRRTWNLTK